MLKVVDPLLGVSAEEETRIIEQARLNDTMREKLRLRAKAESNTKIFTDAFVPIAETLKTATDGGVPWLKSKPKLDNYFLALHEEIIAFTKWVSLTREEKQFRSNFLARIAQVCSAIWPTGRLVVFGSGFTDLQLPSSDIDLVLTNIPTIEDYPDTIRRRHDNHQTIPDCLRILADRLLETSDVTFVEIRDKAKVPLLVLKDGTGTEVDVTVNVEDPLGTSMFIKHEGVDLFPAFRPLTLLLKTFLYQRGLHDTYLGGVGSYLLSCLVLGFLQQHRQSRALSDGDAGLSLGHLIYDFFTFYTRDFNSLREGLSVRGRGSRFDKRDREFEQVAMRRNPDALCVESPLEPHVDIGGKCFAWKVVKQAFIQARLEIVDGVREWTAKTGVSLLCPALVHSRIDRVGHVVEDLVRTEAASSTLYSERTFRDHHGHDGDHKRKRKFSRDSEDDSHRKRR